VPASYLVQRSILSWRELTSYRAGDKAGEVRELPTIEEILEEIGAGIFASET
jgi:hypothetical protein